MCIVGGGFAGLWTAIQLTEREPGLRIALIEQDIAGGGASGRNGGFLSASWFDIDAIVGLFGDEEGLRYGRVQAAAIDAIGSFAAANGIDCWFHKDGTMGVRSGEWQESFGDGLEVFRRLGIADRVELLSAEQTRARADSPRFLDGSFFADGAVCQPARSGARAPPGGARAGRASVRTHAHDRARPVAAGGGAHRARRHQGGQGGVDDGRLGRRLSRRSVGASA